MKYNSNLWDKYKKVEREIRAEFKRGKMFAILEKRIVAGVVAAISLVANLAVFVFLGMVGVIVLTNMRMILGSKIMDTKVKAQAAPSSVQPLVPALIYTSYVVLFLSRCHHQFFHHFCQL